MRRSILMILVLLVSTSLFAQQQIRTPRQSPKASLTQTVGVTDITINYNRPGVKGRQLWGSLVPYGEVWRTGANEATTINFSDDVLINGQNLPKGTYSLHTIPGPEEWTVIFNKVADQWGSYSYDAANDALRVRVKPEKSEFREWMGFDVAEMTTDTAKVALRWENLSVPFTVDTKSTERTMTQLRNAMQPNWRPSYMAANFAFENPGAATDAEMNAWIDESLKINQNTANLWLKAQALHRQNRRADAIRHAEMAIAAATPQQKDFAGFIRTTIDGWK
jgi:hypothetical protein